MPHKLSVSEQVSYSTARIECHLPDSRVSIGSGVFFNFCPNRIPCLVTNRHVVEGAISASIFFHTADVRGRPNPNLHYQMKLIDLDINRLYHPNPEIDLAVVAVGGILSQMDREGHPPFVLTIPSEFIPSEDDLANLTAVEDVLMVGYPLGLADERHQLPIFRRGITATHPLIDYNGRPEFMIDAACFPGSSGSPVFLWNQGTYPTREGRVVVGSRIKFLGILYAGPLHTVEGTVEVVEVPTRQEAMSRAGIPANLGYVLKARLIADFEPIVASKVQRKRA